MKFGVCVLMAYVLMAGHVEATEIMFGGYSHHIGKTHYRDGKEKRELNEYNRMVGVAGGNWSVGVMKNSFYKNSVFLSRNFDYEIHKALHVGVKAGLVTGYGNTPVNLDVAPLVQLEAMIKAPYLKTVLGYTPPISDSTKGVLTLHWVVSI